MQDRIETKLREVFAPAHLEVVNESGQHNVPPGATTHFRVVVVSGAFAGKSRIVRHQLVYQALSQELQSGLHALAIVAKSPEEADSLTPSASPPCLGGSKR